MRNFWEDFGRTLLKIWWCGILTVSLGASLFDGTARKNLAVMANISWLIILQNLALIVVVVSTLVALTKLHPIFKWSWFSLFKSREGDEMNGRNINLIPMQVKYFGLLFALLLIVNLPSLAKWEEECFRGGTKGWAEGLLFSFLFGMTHCLVGVPIGAGLAIGIAGLWYTHQYFVGGVELSTLHHTTFNLILVSVLFLLLVIQHIAEWSEKKAPVEA